MKLSVCSVFDSALQAFTRPVFVPSTGIAIRSFTDEVNRAAPPSENPMFGHPEDFELRLLAMFDEDTGLFENSSDGPRVLARGKDVKQV